MMTFDSSLFMENLVGCNFLLKHYITVLLRQYTLNQFLNLSRANKNLEIFMRVFFEQFKNRNSFELFSLDNVSINRNYFKNIK